MGLTLWSVISLVAAAAVPLPTAQHPDVGTIIARSVEVCDADWKAAPLYDFTETDRGPHGSDTYEVKMIRGTPYSRRLMENGKPLAADQALKEQQRLEEAIAERRAESPEEAARRIAKYEKDRNQDYLLMSQMSKAFDFQFVREQQMGDRRVWVLKATPRASYQPPNMEAEALTGMNGTLWIDSATFQWVQVEAHVVRPVSIGGFLARVDPGTFFKLEKEQVAPGIWLAKHFVMRSKAEVLWVFKKRGAMDETYTGYHQPGASPRQRAL